MALTYDEAVAIQRRHEARLMALPGVNAVGVKQTSTGPVLEVTVAPDVDLAAELTVDEVGGVPLTVVRGRFTLH
ncbi:hypothetical protein [Cellulomonas palmilytica]|uniref:hypothetical protein n=1 Tax=Cellulomonas palmilytica TaxID=2608402 RepID=UPI001F2D581D|nr:hypothetical protein [Cellulomonas palmilytica]UJP40607.1 hypothetical protein F1D97_03625 [Cellulomonas palmilytica]